MSEHITMQPDVVAHLPLDVIDFDPDQPRKDIDLVHIAEMAEDIGKRGVVQPITVRAGAETGRYVIKYGECRYRASIQAKKATIPALLDTEEEHGDLLSRLLDQVKENHLRRGLNPMEWAGVLLRMRNDHKIRSMAKIEDTLREHGITNMGRSYISNMIRLLELPEWAQDLIRDGKFTAAHGKYLLPACASDAVLNQLHGQIEKLPEPPPVRRLQELVFWAFQQLHVQVDRPYNSFDYKIECVNAGCQKMRKIGREGHESCTFCLDSECFRAKDAAGKERLKERQEQLQNGQGVIPIVAADNTVDTTEQQDVVFMRLDRARFDVEGCMTCENRHIAIVNGWNGEKQQHQGCFDGACFNAKQKAFDVAASRAGRMEDIVEKWLAGQITERLKGDLDAQLAVIGMACMSSEYGDREFTYRLSEAQYDIRKQTRIVDIADMLSHGLPHHAQLIAEQLLKAARPFLLVPLADHLGIDIAIYRIDEDYLEYLDDEGLAEIFLANAHCWPESSTDDIRNTCATLDNAELIGMLQRRADQIKTPDEIQAAWTRLRSEFEHQKQEAAEEQAEPESDGAAA